MKMDRLERIEAEIRRLEEMMKCSSQITIVKFLHEIVRRRLSIPTPALREFERSIRTLEREHQQALRMIEREMAGRRKVHQKTARFTKGA